jgi:hypothetical protein
MSLPSLLSLVKAPPAPPATLGPIAAADRAVLERVLAASHVARVPEPPASSYFGELATAFNEAVVAALLRGARMFHLSRTAFLVLAALAVLAMLALALRALLPAFLRAGRARRPRPYGERVALPAPPPELDAAAWRAVLEARLAAGEPAAALLALWWWLARSLAGSRAEADWTSRELMAQARRPDLAPLAQRLDALTYGPGQPSLDDLRTLVGRLEAALGLG